MSLDIKNVEMVFANEKLKKAVLLSLGLVLLVVIVSVAKAVVNCELTFTPPNTETGICIYVYTPPYGGYGGGYGGGISFDGGTSPGAPGTCGCTTGGNGPGETGAVVSWSDPGAATFMNGGDTSSQGGGGKGMEGGGGGGGKGGDGGGGGGKG
jgi:hypothetical protein